MYRRVGDRVDIIGAVTVTIPADNLALVVANLPTGYRPFNAVSVVQTSNAVYQDAFFARVGYFANGEIRIVWGARVDGNQPTQVNIYLNTSYYIANGVLQIIKHPEDVTAQVGETAQFTVRALGEERTYKWQTSTNGGSSWINSSFISSTTATLSIPVTAARNGYMYRCIVTSADGKHLVTSEAATLTVTE